MRQRLLTRLTDEQRAAIAVDPRSHASIAFEYGIRKAYVSRVKQEAGTSGRVGTYDRRNAAAAPGRKPLPDRHYRPSWDEPVDGKRETRP